MYFIPTIIRVRAVMPSRGVCPTGLLQYVANKRRGELPPGHRGYIEQPRKGPDVPAGFDFGDLEGLGGAGRLPGR